MWTKIALFLSELVGLCIVIYCLCMLLWSLSHHLIESLVVPVPFRCLLPSLSPSCYWMSQRVWCCRLLLR